MLNVTEIQALIIVILYTVYDNTRRNLKTKGVILVTENTLRRDVTSFPAIFYSSLWGAPTQNPAPEIFFICKKNKFSGAGFLITGLWWLE